MSESDRFGFSVLSRRRWLRLVLGAGVTVAGGSAALRFLRGPVPDGAAGNVLSARELATFAALARAVPEPFGGTLLDLPHFALSGRKAPMHPSRTPEYAKNSISN